MYDFEEDGIVNYTSNGCQSDGIYLQQCRRKSKKESSSERIFQPWTDQSFQLQTLTCPKPQQKSVKKNTSRNSYSKIRASESKPHSTSREYNDLSNPIYRVDTEEQNLEERIKWRMEYQFMRARRKKATDIIRIKHYGHMRSHTINPAHLLTADSEDQTPKNNTVINIQELSKQIHQYTRKQGLSCRIKAALKGGDRSHTLEPSNAHTFSERLENNKTVQKKNLENNRRVFAIDKTSMKISQQNQFKVLSLTKMSDLVRNQTSTHARSLKPKEKARQVWQQRKSHRNPEFKISLPKREKAIFCAEISTNSIYKLKSYI